MFGHLASYVNDGVCKAPDWCWGTGGLAITLAFLLHRLAYAVLLLNPADGEYRAVLLQPSYANS